MKHGTALLRVQVSHLPDDGKYERVIGHGMNAQEVICPPRACSLLYMIAAGAAGTTTFLQHHAATGGGSDVEGMRRVEMQHCGLAAFQEPTAGELLCAGP